MNIAVVGSVDWEDYPTLMRKLVIEIEDWTHLHPEDDRLVFIHGGSRGAEDMVTEFVGKVSALAKQKNKIITDKVFRSKTSNKYEELAMSDIDKAIVFQKNHCKKTSVFANIVQEIGIPLVIVKE